jgi:hypothetical protein
MAFSADGKNLLALTGAPDYTLVCWAWERGKATSLLKVSGDLREAIYKCSFNPVDPTIAAVCGNGVFTFFRVTDSMFKPMPYLLAPREPENYLCHCWLTDGKVLVRLHLGVLSWGWGGCLRHFSHPTTSL